MGNTRPQAAHSLLHDSARTFAEVLLPYGAKLASRKREPVILESIVSGAKFLAY